MTLATLGRRAAAKPSLHPLVLALRRAPAGLCPLAVPAVFFGGWEILAHAGLIKPAFLPSLEEIAGRAVNAVREGGLADDLLASLERNLAGFAIGASSGVALGLAIGFSRLLRRMLAPVLLMHRQIALFAWVPLISMWFGGGEAGKVAFIAFAAFQPTLVNTWQGVADIPLGYRELAAVLTFSRLDFVRMIAIPGALPQIFNGLHAGLIYAWTATIGAELMLNIGPGIGGRMNEAQHLFHMDLLLVCVLLLGVVGLLFNLLAYRLEHRLMRWRRAK